MQDPKVQFATADSADFEANTWTFEMEGNYRVAAGRYAILPEQEYKRLLEMARAEKAMTPLEIEAANAIDAAHGELSKNEKACVENYSRILAILGMDEEDDPVAAVEYMRETLQGIAEADWRRWEELASPDEFVRWAKARANHALMTPTTK